MYSRSSIDPAAADVIKSYDMADNWMKDGPGKGNRKNQRFNIAMKRVPGEMRVEHTSQIVKCRVFLHDINPTGVGLFCDASVDLGSKVELVIEVPKPLYLKARIAWCSEAGTTSHIISAETFGYRAGLEFLFDNPGAAEEFKAYCNSLTKLAPA